MALPRAYYLHRLPQFSSSVLCPPMSIQIPFYHNIPPLLSPVRTPIISSFTTSPSSLSTPPPPPYSNSRWKPICLYFTQGKCTKMDDPIHLEKFNHNCSRDLQVNAGDFERKRSQDFDFFLVLDLEGKVEILEYPVLIVDAKTMDVVDLFHRFVRPSAMSEQRINQYIEGKYGKFGVDRVWHDTAVPFKEVLQQFEAWLTKHQLWGKELGGRLNRAAFVTCGDWDLKTKVPEQCKVSTMKIPPYFMEWINLKDAYANFYGTEVSGMRTMLNHSNIPLLGSHHLGIDDTKNIAKVLQRMLADGALMQITAWRNPDSQKVKFAFKDGSGSHQKKRKTFVKRGHV